MKGLGGEEGKGGNVYKRNKGKVRKRGGVKHYNYIRTEKTLKNIFDKLHRGTGKRNLSVRQKKRNRRRADG